MQQDLLQKTQVAEIGEHIGLEAGEEMVKRFFDKHPDQAYGNTISKEVIEKILAQPGCEGILCLPSYDNIDGDRHLVLVGIDCDTNPIYMYNVVTEDGSITANRGLIISQGGGGGGSTGNGDVKKDVEQYSWSS
jgi:hypothetical protein